MAEKKKQKKNMDNPLAREARDTINSNVYSILFIHSFLFIFILFSFHFLFFVFVILFIFHVFCEFLLNFFRFVCCCFLKYVFWFLACSLILFFPCFVLWVSIHFFGSFYDIFQFPSFIFFFSFYFIFIFCVSLNLSLNVLFPFQFLSILSNILALHEISNLLNTGLDKETLAICVTLIENGANPEALAAVVKEIKREAAFLVLFFSFQKYWFHSLFFLSE